MKSEHKNQRNRKGKRGRGWLTSPSCTSARGEKKGPAEGTARRDPATEAPRPGRSTAARSPAGSAHAGEGAGDGAGARCSTHSPYSLSLGFIATAERGEESGEERKKREKGRGRMALGLRGAERRWGFDRPKRPLGRPIGFNGARCAGQRPGPGGRARKAEFLAQAQVVA